MIINIGDYKERKDIEYQKQYDNLETRCWHQDLAFHDPSIVMSNTFYDQCYVCKDYSKCKDYEPMGDKK